MASRAGSPNKNKQRLLKALQAEYGEDFDPVMQMAKNAHEIQKKIDEDESSSDVNRMDAINAWDKVAVYTTPKLKSIEVTGDPEAPVYTAQTTKTEAAAISAALDEEY